MRIEKSRAGGRRKGVPEGGKVGAQDDARNDECDGAFRKQTDLATSSSARD